VFFLLFFINCSVADFVAIIVVVASIPCNLRLFRPPDGSRQVLYFNDVLSFFFSINQSAWTCYGAPHPKVWGARNTMKIQQQQSAKRTSVKNISKGGSLVWQEKVIRTFRPSLPGGDKQLCGVQAALRQPWKIKSNVANYDCAID